MTKVSKNIICQKKQEEIKQVLLSENFPWFYYPQTIKFKETKNNKIFEASQFTHIFYKYTDKTEVNSQFSYIADQILQQFLYSQNLDKCELLRCKANLQLRQADSFYDHYNTPHKDLDTKHHVLLYYVNSNDASTFLFDNAGKINEKIPSEQGDFAFFNGDTLHAGSHPIESNVRCVINYNLRIQE